MERVSPLGPFWRVSAFQEAARCSANEEILMLDFTKSLAALLLLALTACASTAGISEASLRAADAEQMRVNPRLERWEASPGGGVGVRSAHEASGAVRFRDGEDSFRPVEHLRLARIRESFRRRTV